MSHSKVSRAIYIANVESNSIIVSHFSILNNLTAFESVKALANIIALMDGAKSGVLTGEQIDKKLPGAMRALKRGIIGLYLFSICSIVTLSSTYLPNR